MNKRTYFYINVGKQYFIPFYMISVSQQYQRSCTVLQLVDEIRLYLPDSSAAWSDELLQLVLTKGGGSRNTRLAYTRKRVKQFEKDLKEFYEDTGYECMDTDVQRNKYFTGAIKEAVKQGYFNWVEVGPGALGTLSKMILKAHSDTKLVAVEAVVSSVKSLKTKLRKWLQANRANIVQGLAGKISLEGVECDVLIGEVLGHVSSSEGWTATLHALGKQNPHWKKNIKVIIPGFYGTKMVPVDLSAATTLDSDIVVGDRLAFIPSLPFKEVQLTPQHEFLERYSSLEEFKSGSGKDPRCSGALFNITESRPFHGLALYVVYGSESDSSSWQHSNTNLPGACTNWYNVFVPVCKGQVLCQAGDTISTHTRVWIDTYYPRYEIKVQVLRDGQVVAGGTSTFDYYDLVCTRCPIYGWEPC